MRILAWMYVALAASGAFAQEDFTWPNGARAAISLSFDDGRPSQVDKGLAVFARHGARVSFYVVPSAVEQRLEGWRDAVNAGHEIGNHSLVHPCSGNFAWSRHKALENYTVESMGTELREANARIEALLGVTATSFAYPCGQTFVGRGTETQSYVPVAAELFVSARGWLDEAPNDPAYVDMAQLTGMELDGKTFEDLLPLLENARKHKQWLVLAGHDIGEEGNQTTRIETLDRLFAYLKSNAEAFWLAPVGEVAAYVAEQRKDER